MEQYEEKEVLGEIRKAPSNLTEKPTYLTTFQQFLCNQLPKSDQEQSASETNNKKMSNKTILTPKPIQAPPVKSVQKESSHRRSPMPRQTKRQSVSPRATSNKSPAKRTKLQEKFDESSQEEWVPSDDSEEENISSGPESTFQEEAFKAYECKICSFETIYEGVYNEHMLTHKKKETFHKCPRCTFKVKCRAAVKKHLVMDESEGDVEYCGLYAYSDECKGDLDQHLKVHRGGRNGSVSLRNS